MQTTTANQLANLIQAKINCRASGNDEWFDKHLERADLIAREFLPSGSGINAGTQIDWEKSTGDKIVLITGFHHMDENGCYDGWTDHNVTVKASLVHGLDITISGRNRNDIKEYLGQMFWEALTTEQDWNEYFVKQEDWLLQERKQRYTHI